MIQQMMFFKALLSCSYGKRLTGGGKQSQHHLCCASLWSATLPQHVASCLMYIIIALTI